MMKKFIYMAAVVMILASCKEEQIALYDTTNCSLNIAKGEFFPNTYPESHYFNAYFLGVGSGDYELDIPVRLSGVPDFKHDRKYKVRINPEKSEKITKDEDDQDVEFTLSRTQTFRRGLHEDTIRLVIHVEKLNTEDLYKIRLELEENENFVRGLDEYQYIDITFMKNINLEPPFWTNDSKLSKFPYHPLKGEKFLEVSGITDPEWEYISGTGSRDYWIQTCIDWFENHEVIDTATGNRIYFDK